MTQSNILFVKSVEVVSKDTDEIIGPSYVKRQLSTMKELIDNLHTSGAKTHEFVEVTVVGEKNKTITFNGFITISAPHGKPEFEFNPKLNMYQEINQGVIDYVAKRIETIYYDTLLTLKELN